MINSRGPSLSCKLPGKFQTRTYLKLNYLFHRATSLQGRMYLGGSKRKKNGLSSHTDTQNYPEPHKSGKRAESWWEQQVFQSTRLQRKKLEVYWCFHFWQTTFLLLKTISDSFCSYIATADNKHISANQLVFNSVIMKILENRLHRAENYSASSLICCHDGH